MDIRLRNRLRIIFQHVLKSLSSITYFIPGNSRRVPVLVYHRICPLHYKKEIPYANVYPEDFENQMRYLADYFEPITVTEYIQRVKTRTLSGNEACITFDDGFRDNYMFAFPILKKYSLKATFFLTTKYIGLNMLFPWMALDTGAKKDVISNRERWLPLSWDQVREMKDYGMEFGTHTHTHRTSLSNLSMEEANREIKESTETFRNMLGDYPKVFSFPHGTCKDYSKYHIEILKSYKYEASLTTNIGRNSEEQDLFELKRLIIYEDDSLWEFRKKLKGAYDIAGAFQKVWLKLAGSRPYSNSEL